MVNEYKFTWERMSLSFPENKEDMNRIAMEFDQYYPQSPDFSNNQISFAYKEEYGIQMHLNQIIEPWIETASKDIKAPILRMYSDLSHKLYNETIKELDASFEVLEGWRKFIAKNDKGYWEGNLQNQIDFRNGRNIITLGDYYKFYINSNCKDNCPTDILHKIQKLPKDSLNEKWKKYYELSENVSKGIDRNTSNEIIGDNFAECIKNADIIYKMADELKKLKF